MPGGLLDAGRRQRDVALFISRPTDPADESTPITVELATHYWMETVPDVDPSDNTVHVQPGPADQLTCRRSAAAWTSSGWRLTVRSSRWVGVPVGR